MRLDHRQAGPSVTEDDIRAFCQGQIAHYKVPRYIRFVDAFPMTVTGKIQKFKIREVMSATLGLTPKQPPPKAVLATIAVHPSSPLPSFQSPAMITSTQLNPRSADFQANAARHAGAGR